MISKTRKKQILETIAEETLLFLDTIQQHYEELDRDHWEKPDVLDFVDGSVEISQHGKVIWLRNERDVKQLIKSLERMLQ